MNRTIASLGALVLLGVMLGTVGCTVGPDFTRPDLAATYPSLLGIERPHAQVSAPWWSALGNAVLDAHVARALRNSPDVEAAQAALISARELKEAQRSTLFPTIVADARPSRQRTSGALSSVPADGTYVYDLHTARLSLTYTPDLFGGNRRSIEALLAQTDAQRYQWEATRLTLIANVCLGQIIEASLQAQLDAVDASVVIQQRSLDIVQRRLALGDASHSDLLLQAASLATTQAQRPALEKQLSQQRDRDAALEGSHTTDDLAPAPAMASITLPRDLPTQAPSVWLERRPDIKLAEAQWHAASANVGVAIAARLPVLSLSADMGSSAATLGKLFGPGTAFWDMAGDLAAPLFDGGALKHRQRAAEASNRQAAALYRSTVINAFANVSDALRAREADERAYRLAERSRDIALESYRIAQAQYAAGDVSTLTLLSVEQGWRDAELALITAQMNRLEDAVALLQSTAGDEP
jgi:NodT family efflux transporter outer membrane factor (OMF) lipoprotein